MMRSKRDFKTEDMETDENIELFLRMLFLMSLIQKYRISRFIQFQNWNFVAWV
jgi:hypothetical protein